MIVSRASRRDAPAMAKIMHAAIWDADRYSVPQRFAWSPRVRSPKYFAGLFRNHAVWAARTGAGLQGFIALRKDGYINLVFLHRTVRGTGAFRALVECLDDAAPLTVHASLHAQGPFQRMGFRLVRHEVIPLNGQVLRRAFMRLD